MRGLGRAAAVAAVLAGTLGIALLLVASCPSPSRDPLAALPAGELRLAVAGKGLHALSERLARYPRHGALLRALTSARFGQRLGWPQGTPPPPDPLRSDAPIALGFYDHGWCAAKGVVPSGWGIAGRTGELELVASDPAATTADGRAPTRGASARPPRDGIAQIVGDVRVLAGGRSEASARGWISRWLPAEVDGSVEVSGGTVRDRWRFDGGPSSVLDLFDPRPSPGVLSQGWSALPDDASALTWFRLAPERIRDAPGPGAVSGLGERLDGLERFLGLPLRQEFAAAIAGPGVAALREPGRDGAPHVLIVLELSRPEAARRVVDRLLVLGVLASEFRVSTYRGVTIGAASLVRGSRRIEPAAAIDGDLFLLASHRADLEDAIDRRREPAAEARAARFRSRLEGLPAGSWKAWSTSSFAVDGWSRMLEIPIATGARAPLLEAVLRREGTSWVLEGRGDAPAWQADMLIPAVRWALRG